jgi:hypothetical protein
MIDNLQHHSYFFLSVIKVRNRKLSDKKKYIFKQDVFRFQWHRTYFAKYSYNKNYQNVNSKRFQLTTVYFLTLNDHLACAIRDFDI